MKQAGLWLTATVLAIAAWTTLNFLATTEGWLLKPIAPEGDVPAFSQALTEYAQSQNTGNLVFAILDEKGLPVSQQFFSEGRAVNSDSLFGVASLSKWVTAVGVMTLVEDGILALDEPVETYLKRWHLPPSEFDNNAVTLRRLLSHTAGITDGLGHDGFKPGEPVQALTEHLTKAADADPAVDGRVRVGMAPGSRWMYSGGSYNLVQLIIEDATGADFTEVMQARVFTPLGMKDTGFTVPRDNPRLAEYFGENGERREYPNYTSLAATGLYTSLHDLIIFAQAQLPSSAVGSDQPRLLSDASLAQMRAPLANVDGLDIWGAGVIIYAPLANGDNVIGHGGQSPFLNASVRVNPATGAAFIAIQTGNANALASDLGTLWTTWQTGKPDLYILRNTLGDMVLRILIGTALIILLVTILAVIKWRRSRSTHKLSQQLMSGK
ncbi:serine hydrolase domain-containing protein [Alteromonas lipolytica]|uniref:Beta-lactamase-related domain-containing protein n=1 Tax=Alteromonas lipolytica TaxID=1856405 RepID=A0A1E8FGK9_9ALTE|nr:serine hydrolase domain-containing protein [Alteromonas lipolytica]OFI35070.1 hypothetical protein BFC17_16090 [Alteromonas lipolytica]GGF56389.1 hypothetical protein GCM10011338_05850 [Alteromonas lipolytica]